MFEGARQHVLLSWAPHPDGIGHICDGDGLSSHMGLIETKNNKTFPTGANRRLPDPPNLPLPPQTQPIKRHYVTESWQCHKYQVSTELVPFRSICSDDVLASG